MKSQLNRMLTRSNVAIASFSLCLSEMIPGDKALVDDMLVYQESLKPDHDIQYIVQQYCVSSFSPQPILYENQFHGVSQGNVKEMEHMRSMLMLGHIG